MSVTGVLLTYERQMTAWADGYSVRRPAPAPEPLGVEALAALAREASESGELTIDHAARRAGARRLLASAASRPSSSTPTRARSWARARSAPAPSSTRSPTGTAGSAAEGESRPTARAVTGASNLVFLFIVLSGIYLWWPKALDAAAPAPDHLFQGGLSGKARDFNWHNVIGFWSAIPLVFVVASGVVISYPWATDLVYRLTGSEPPRRGGPGRAGGGDAAARFARRPRPGLGHGHEPGARLAEPVPARAAGPEAPWSFTIDTWIAARNPSTRAQLVVDRTTGEVVRFEPYASQSRGAKVRGWLRFLHTGEAFGFSGQTVAGLASAGAVMLAWTGVSLALRRFAAWRRRRVAARSSVAPDGATTT